MMAVVTKPTVLISSTIYDFSDLRSALRHWLSELGYDVLLSEFNDFPKSLDENSYESCLNAVKRADYFILLIGARTGGWYDAANRISITRMEFREALKRYRETGEPKLAVFVRQSLWDIREDRTALERYLVDDHAHLRELDEAARAALPAHPSRFVNNATSTFEFLREVGQIEEMKAASAGEGALPKGNWIHLFSEFADVVAALRIAFGVTGHIERKILIENLRQELLENLRHLLWKGNSHTMPISEWARSASGRITTSINDESDLTIGDVNRLMIFRVSAAAIPNRLGRLFVQQAVESGLSMEFDSDRGQHVPSRAHAVLLELLSLIPSAQRQIPSGQDLGRFCDRFKTTGRNRDEMITVRNIDIAAALGEARVLGRITELCACLLLLLEGKRTSLDAMRTWTASPFAEEAEQMQQEEATMEDVTAWLAKFGCGGTEHRQEKHR